MTAIMSHHNLWCESNISWLQDSHMKSMNAEKLIGASESWPRCG